MLAFAASILLSPSFSVFAVGIDDIMSYQPKSVQPESGSVQPYTIQDIINKLPGMLDDNGVYNGIEGLPEFMEESQYADPRTVAFDVEKFGKCDDFYIHKRYSYGGIAFRRTLEYFFPENEKRKIRVSSDLKSAMKYIEDPGNLYYGDKRCVNRYKYISNLKEILNSAIQAAPMILQEKQRMVAMEQAGKIQNQNRENEKAKAKQQAEEKAKADRQAIEFAEIKGREDRSNKLKACQNTNDYKLYEISTAIEGGQVMVNDAQLEIQRQKEGAKISGYVDKQVMYQMGNRIVGVSRLNNENYQVYKKLGGSAQNIESIHKLPNPCQMYIIP